MIDIENKRKTAHERYLRNKEKMNAQSAAWYFDHKERSAFLTKRWRLNHPEKKAENANRTRIWKQLNREKALEHKRKWGKKFYSNNREEILAKSREKRKFLSREYRDRENKRGYEWKKAHPEKAREIRRRWNEKNPDKLKIYWLSNHRNRKSRIQNSNGNLDTIRRFISSVKSKRLATCYYCQKTVSTRAIHFDHIVPLSKGGPHSVENLCVSCVNCNQHKHAHLFGDWMKVGQQLLEL